MREQWFALLGSGVNQIYLQTNLTLAYPVVVGESDGIGWIMFALLGPGPIHYFVQNTT
jgi:hypothetical protein